VTGRLIALEGPDGVGKTPIAARLTDLTYPEAVAALTSGTSSNHHRGLVLVPRRQVSATSTYAAGLMDHLSTVLWHSGDDPCLSDAYWVAVQAAWGIAHTETVLKPLLDAGFDVLVDGWFYKLFGKLAVQGWREEDIDVIFSRVRMPDSVILLTADLGEIYDRRGADFRPAELGMHAGYPELNRDAFLAYQSQALHRLQQRAHRDGWTTVALDIQAGLTAHTAKVRPHLNRARAAARIAA
jgi:thymidylate kinase